MDSLQLNFNRPKADGNPQQYKIFPQFVFKDSTSVVPALRMSYPKLSTFGNCFQVTVASASMWFGEMIVIIRSKMDIMV